MKQCTRLCAEFVWAVAIVVSMCAPARSAPAPGLTQAEQQDLVDYGLLPSFEHLAISPNGLRLAYIGTVGEVRHVLVKDLADGHKLIDFTAAVGQKLRGLQWADNDHILARVSMTTEVSLWGGERDEYFGVIAADLNTGQAWDVLNYKGGLANNVGRVGLVFGRVRARRINQETWLFVNGYFGSSSDFSPGGRMMKINLASRSHTIVESRDTFKQYGRLLDELGRPVAVSDYDSERRRWQIAVGTAGNLRPAMSGEAELDIPTLQGISPDSKDVWLLTWNHRIATPGSVALADGETASAGRLDARLHRAAWSDVMLDARNDRAIAGIIEYPSGAEYEFLDPQTDQQWRRILKTLGAGRPAFVSGSDDNQRVIVQVETANGPTYLLADMGSGKITTLGPQYRQLPPVGEMRAIEYEASDGLKIPAYLTLPAGRPAKGLPLVVLPHGGPEASDGYGFDWWAQALANQGYAVMQPNFRGSTVSDAFVVAGQGEWGRKMQTDLSDGVQYLAQQGIIDPARVCIVGASYGGYAALAGVSLQNGIYRCAVAVAGVSDLRRLVTPSAGFRANANYGVRYWERWLGVKDIDDPSVDARSPLRNASAIHVPVLLIHGRNDMVVPYQQSRWLADELNRQHKSCKLIDLKGEDHWLSHSLTRLQMLVEVSTFLKANNPAGPSGAPAQSSTQSSTH